MGLKYIENVIIGKPLCEPSELFAVSEKDWELGEKPQTLFTDERFLPRILVQLGIFNSTSEVKKNRPDLYVVLDKFDFINRLRIGKRYLWICVGE